MHRFIKLLNGSGLHFIPGLFFFITGLLIAPKGLAQSIDPSLLVNQWQASWIAVPGESPDGYGVYLFRKLIDLKTKPDSFVIHVSADNRYKLFVNEKPVSLGPARGDLDHWNFTTLDIAPFLQAGEISFPHRFGMKGNGGPKDRYHLERGLYYRGLINMK